MKVAVCPAFEPRHLGKRPTADPGDSQLPERTRTRAHHHHAGTHQPSDPDSAQREKNAQEAAAALGPRGSEYRADAGSAEPPDQ